MTENDSDKDLELEDAIDPTEVKEGEEDKNDYKDLAKKNAGIAKRNATRLKKIRDAKAADKKKEEEAGGAASDKNKKSFDLGEKGYMKSSGIAPSEYAFVLEYLNDTGKDLEAAIDSPRFQAELKDFRKENATKEATPDGSNRSTNTSRDSVEYWIDRKDENGKLLLPPPDQRELRTKVVNARIKKEKDGRMFSPTSVV